MNYVYVSKGQSLASSMAAHQWPLPVDSPLDYDDYYTSHTLLHLTEYVGAYQLRNTLLIDFNLKLYAFFLKPPLLLLSASFWEICLSVVNANLFGQVNKNCKGSIRMP